MKEDEILNEFKRHADTINQLNKNQQVLVKTIDELKAKLESSSKVDEIIKQVKEETDKAEAKAETKTETKEEKTEK